MDQKQLLQYDADNPPKVALDRLSDTSETDSDALRKSTLQTATLTPSLPHSLAHWLI